MIDDDYNSNSEDVNDNNEDDDGYDVWGSLWV